MSIDLEQYPVVTGTCEHTGYYFVKDLTDPCDYQQMVRYRNGSFFPAMHVIRGPVHFGPCAPHLDLSTLDLSKYPVVDKPDRPGLWIQNKNGVPGAPMGVTQEMIGKPGEYHYGCHKWQRIGDFTPPAPALPEVPEVRVSLVRHEAEGDFWAFDNGDWWIRVAPGVSRSKAACKVLATRTLAAKEVV